MGYCLFKDAISICFYLFYRRFKIQNGAGFKGHREVRSTAGRQRELDRHNIHLPPPLLIMCI